MIPDYVRNAIDPTGGLMQLGANSIVNSAAQIASRYALSNDAYMMAPSHLMNQAMQVTGLASMPIPTPPPQAGFVRGSNMAHTNALTTNALDRISGSVGRHMQDTLGGSAMGKVVGSLGGFGERYVMGQIGMGAGYQQALNYAVQAGGAVSSTAATVVQQHLVDAAQMSLSNPSGAGVGMTGSMNQAQYAGMVGRMVGSGAINMDSLRDDAINSLVAEGKDGKGFSRSLIMKRLGTDSILGDEMRMRVTGRIQDGLAKEATGRAELLDKGKSFFGDMSPEKMEQRLRQQYSDFDTADSSTLKGRLDFVDKLSKTFETNVGAILDAQKSMTQVVENSRRAVGDTKLIDPVTGQAVAQSSISAGGGERLGQLTATTGTVLSQSMRGMSEVQGRAMAGNTFGKMLNSTLSSRLQAAGMAEASGTISKDVYADIKAAAEAGDYRRLQAFDISLQEATGIGNLNDQGAIAAYINDATATLQSQGRDGMAISRRVGRDAESLTKRAAASRVGSSKEFREMNRNFMLNQSMRKELGVGGTASSSASGSAMADIIRGELADNSEAYGFGQDDEGYVQSMLAEIEGVSGNMSATELSSYMQRTFGSRGGKLARMGLSKATDAAVVANNESLKANAGVLTLAQGLLNRDTGREGATVALSGEQRRRIGQLRSSVRSGEEGAADELSNYLTGLRGSGAVTASEYDRISTMAHSDAEDLLGRVGKQEELQSTRDEIVLGKVGQMADTKLALTGNYADFMSKGKRGGLSDMGLHKKASIDFLKAHAGVTLKDGQERHANILAYASGQLGTEVDWKALEGGETDITRLLKGNVDTIRKQYRENVLEGSIMEEDSEKRSDMISAMSRKGAPEGRSTVNIAEGTKFDLSDATMATLVLGIKDAVANSKTKSI